MDRTSEIKILEELANNDGQPDHPLESVFKKGPEILNHCDISDPYLIKENRKNMNILEEDNLNILG